MTQTFRCGCTTDASARCKQHERYECHTPGSTMVEFEYGECPPCWRARLTSVGIAPAATPTRSGVVKRSEYQP